MNLTTAFVLFAWFVVLCGAVVALMTGIRKTVKGFKPQWEASEKYKTILALASLPIGIGIALLGNTGIPWILALVGQDTIVIPWSFVVILGLVVGMSSAFVWTLAKGWIKAKFSLEADAEK